MNRRIFMGAAAGAIASLTCVRSAPATLGLQARKSSKLWEAWRKIPSVVVLSDVNDARLPAVYDAVRFWNDMFLSLGSPFHFGPVTHVAEVIPHDELHQYRWIANLLEWSAGWYNLSSRVMNIQGDVIVALSDGSVSSAARIVVQHRVLIIIRKFQTYDTTPPTTLNGAQDTIAHELGHAIGLGHNGDSTSLMCGPCRFAEREGFSPLTDDEKTLLLEMYPPSWREQPE